MDRSKLYYIVEAGLIAAIYVVLTYISAFLGLAYGSLQFRISELLTILPIFTSAAIPGLCIGCFISNLSSPLGVVDIICGTLATFLGAVFTRALRNIKIKGIPILAPLPPVITNSIIVSLVLCFAGSAQASIANFVTFALSIAITEFIVCYLSLPFVLVYKRINKEHRMFKS